MSSPSTGKRGRGINTIDSQSDSSDGVHVDPNPFASLRQHILDRIDYLNPALISAAARYHVSPSSEAVLGAICTDIAASLTAVSISAESGRQQLQTLRIATHTAIDSRIDALLEAFENDALCKVSALERELLTMHTALEDTLVLHTAARDSATTADDTIFAAAYNEFVVRLSALDSTVMTLPVAPIEPALLRIDFDMGVMLDSIHTAGTKVAPRGVSAQRGDVEVRGLPTAPVRPGIMLFELALGESYPSRGAAELEAAAASLAVHAQVDISLVSSDGAVQPLEATLSSIPGARGVSVCVSIPSSTVAGSHVVINRVAVAGQPVRSAHWPVSISVNTSMHAPLRLVGAQVNSGFVTPVIDSVGTLYLPAGGDIRMYSSDGTPHLPPLSSASVGLSIRTRASAYHEFSHTLLLADDSTFGSSRLVAVDMPSRGVRWSAELTSSADGIAILPGPLHGVVFVCSYTSSCVLACRLSDGVGVARVDLLHCAYLATDPLQATVFASKVAESGNPVVAFRWDGITLASDGHVDGAGQAVDYRPLTVMPPARGRSTSYLIVGHSTHPTLHVFSLPDRRLVHTHTLTGMYIRGLAADPSGTALAVCDYASKAVHVIPWPLPGMPAHT
jgi:hypothetical protein